MSKRYFLAFAAAFVLLVFSSSGLAVPSGPNMLPDGSFEDASETYNPWSGVDGDGNIHGIDGTQFAVGDDGALYSASFGPSAAVGDLNGDGKPDLVLADTRGYIWYFANSGTPQAPKFTQGQIMPIWLGEKKVNEEGPGTDNIVPRIQLIDYDGSGKLGLVVGTYAGKLFYVPNIGSPAQANFPVTMDIDKFQIGTHTRGVLWCNYLAPFLCHWYGPNLLDLVMGEGTYSANSMYLLRNTNANISPGFTEANLLKIIPGMGLEQLTPTVVDWNNDGKPDILAGDRTGALNLYLNTSPDPAHPTFAPGTHVSVGGSEKLGNFTTVTVCDLTGNKLPNLLIGTDAGTLLYATNTGKLGAPDFSGSATPLQGTNPFAKIIVPNTWLRAGPAGVPDELVTCTNPDLEPHFTFPNGSTTKYALKFSLFPVTTPLFPRRYYPPDETYLREHAIYCKTPSQPFKAKMRYKVHVYAKSNSGIQGLYIQFDGRFNTAKGFVYDRQRMDISVSSDWAETNRDIQFNMPDTIDDAGTQFSIQFRFTGQGTLYLDDFSIKED